MVMAEASNDFPLIVIVVPLHDAPQFLIQSPLI